MPDRNENKQGNQSRGQSAGGQRSQSSGGSRQGDGKVNLNRADRQELMRLEGIGQDLADKIIEYRDRKGGFEKVEDIRHVEGFDETRARKVEEQARI